jgi:hypothetical protein
MEKAVVVLFNPEVNNDKRADQALVITQSSGLGAGFYLGDEQFRPLDLNNMYDGLCPHLSLGLKQLTLVPKVPL